MSTIQIDVPESVLLSTGQSQEEFVREAKFLLALKLFELGRLSSGKAAELCGMNRVDFILLAGRSGVPVADLDDVDRRARVLGLNEGPIVCNAGPLIALASVCAA